MKTISSICLNVTDDCCLNCNYCFVKQQPHYMTYLTAKKAVDWLIKENQQSNETISIQFFGGEPLLCWESVIKPLSLYIRNHLKRWDVDLGITTNGILLTHNKLRFMKKYNIPLLLSMDGDKISQDINRPCKNHRKSSFDILDSKIKLILHYFPDTVFRGTITPNTAKYYSNNLNYAFNKGFQNSFFIVDAFGNWTDDAKQELSNEVRKYSNFLIASFLQDSPIIRQRGLEYIINRLVLNNILVAQENTQRKEFDLDQAPCGSGCTGHVSINYQGLVYSCQELTSYNNKYPQFIIGDIDKGINFDKLQELQMFLCGNKNIYNELCDTCLVESTCNINSCRINNFLITGSPHKQTSIMCWWENLLAKEAIYICNFLGNLNNQPFKEYFHYILTTDMGCLI